MAGGTGSAGVARAAAAGRVGRGGGTAAIGERDAGGVARVDGVANRPNGHGCRAGSQ